MHSSIVMGLSWNSAGFAAHLVTDARHRLPATTLDAPSIETNIRCEPIRSAGDGHDFDHDSISEKEAE
jgi:hypothetical protein